MENNLIQKTSKIYSPGKRVRLVRLLTQLSMREFCRKLDFSVSTLSKIENGLHPLSEKSAKKLCEVLKRERVICSPQWLLQEEGENPYILDKTYTQKSNVLNVPSNEADQNITIVAEIDFFKKINKDSIVHYAKDNSMAPMIEEGDYVGGIKYIGAALSDLDGKNCLIEIEPAHILIRNVRVYKDNSLILLPINLSNKVPIPIVDKSSSIYLIKWIRKV